MGRSIRKAEIRVLGPGSIEDFHAHLVRLDRTSRFPGETTARSTPIASAWSRPAPS